MRTAALLVWLVLAGLAPAQTPLASSLGADDPTDVAIARRRLVLAPRDDVDAEAVRTILVRGEEFQRAAAASVAVHHRIPVDDWDRDPSPFVRAILVRGRPDEECVAAVERGAHDAVAAAAFHELATRRRVDPDLYLAALRPDRERTADLAARHFVHCAAPLPHEVLTGIADDPVTAAPVLRAMSRNPRVAALPWLERLVVKRDDSARKLEAFVAYPRGALTAAHVSQILGDAGELSVGLRQEAAARLDPPEADRLVGLLHQKMLDRLDPSIALDLLSRITERGERHLLALARTMEPAGLERIVDWLASRESVVVDELVRETLRGEDPVATFLLRRAGRVADDRAIRARLVDLLGTEEPERASAAFHALVRGDVYVRAMLDHVFAPGQYREQVESRAAALRDLPLGSFDDDAWHAMLDSDITRVRLGALSRLFRQEHLAGAHEALVMRVAREPGSAGSMAARLLVARGRAGSVQQAWASFDPDRRREIVTAFEDRDEPWVLPLLLDDSLRESPEFRAVRVTLGDRTELDAVLADPARWSVEWLRRREADLARGLRESHLDDLRRSLFGPKAADSRVRLEIVDWLVDRTDLPVGDILARVHRDDEDLGVQELALEGLLRHPEGAPLRERIDDAVGRTMSEDERDLAHAIVAAVRRPLTKAAARSVARILLLAPIGDPRREVADHLASDRGTAPPGVVMINLAMRILREDSSEFWRAAVESAVDELAAHPNRFATGRARLGRIMTEMARTPSVRRRIAPYLARAILDSPDAARAWVGPAHLILAERAYADGDWAEAATAFEAASLAWLVAAPVPPIERLFLPDDDPGAGVVPSARLASRPAECRARLALAQGDPEAATEHLVRAAALAHGDDSAESTIRSLRREVTR